MVASLTLSPLEQKYLFIEVFDRGFFVVYKVVGAGYWLFVAPFGVVKQPHALSYNA
jgi:hypothetical protein